MSAIPLRRGAEEGALSFVESYRRALERFDLDAVAARYRLPLPVIRPDRVRMVDGPDMLRAELGMILDFYRWAGMVRVRAHDVRVDGFDPGMELVSLTWRPQDAAGQVIADIDVTYTLRRALGGHRITAVVAHNEERRRAPILREVLDVLERNA